MGHRQASGVHGVVLRGGRGARGVAAEQCGSGCKAGVSRRRSLGGVRALDGSSTSAASEEEEDVEILVEKWFPALPPILGSNHSTSNTL